MRASFGTSGPGLPRFLWHEATRSISTLPGWDACPAQGFFAGTHLYTWVKRDAVRVKCLTQELKPGLLAPESNALIVRPPHLPQIYITSEKQLYKCNLVKWTSIKLLLTKAFPVSVLCQTTVVVYYQVFILNVGERMFPTCTLLNTCYSMAFFVGLVVYTGHDSKLMQVWKYFALCL